MKFIRRHDLDPHTRIEMVRLAWLNQGIYGTMTHIAQAYHISRTFLYQMTWAAHLQLEMLFSDSKALVQDPPPLWEPLILLLRLGSLVFPGVHNSMIFLVNKEYPYKSSWTLWNKCVTFKIP